MSFTLPRFEREHSTVDGEQWRLVSGNPEYAVSRRGRVYSNGLLTIVDRTPSSTAQLVALATETPACEALFPLCGADREVARTQLDWVYLRARQCWINRDRENARARAQRATPAPCGATQTIRASRC